MNRVPSLAIFIKKKKKKEKEEEEEEERKILHLNKQSQRFFQFSTSRSEMKNYQRRNKRLENGAGGREGEGGLERSTRGESIDRLKIERTVKRKSSAQCADYNLLRRMALFAKFPRINGTTGRKR